MSVTYNVFGSPPSQVSALFNWDQVDRDADCHNYDLMHQICRNIESRGEMTNFTSHDRYHLLQYFKKVKDCKVILEIGVENNPNHLTSTSVFLGNKDDETCYFGVDIEDKSSIRNEEKNIFTIQTRAENMDEVMAYLNSKGHTEIDFLFIDGWHSINQVIKEFEYTKYLSKGGIVGFHDTNHHPGPKYFLETIDRDVWEVAEFSGTDPMFDFGVGFVWRK
jgi:hypothetical protein